MKGRRILFLLSAATLFCIPELVSADTLCVKTKQKVKGAKVALGKSVTLATGDANCPKGYTSIDLSTVQATQGAQGIQGEAGPKGDAGPQGPAGPQGSPADLSLENVQTVKLVGSACGADVSYSSTGRTFVASSSSFTKFADDTILEISLQADFVVPTDRAGTANVYGVSINGISASNGGGEFPVRGTEVGGTFLRGAIEGLYAPIPSGSYTIDLYVRGLLPNAVGNHAEINPGCFDGNYVTIRELRIP
ncbi:MAG: collagen-like protein [Bdellovibrionales bacterium]|nr:collagen-like protein [Bdellovibrionales bacterium]